ncbi:hypothetical protein [Streptomyces subrutilus]|uniref:Uncharacterized protein n=1 Tax=Streptomyces subrutilus TaxID=36818 RepID=A0A1E5PM29_9ACTN|nr:hypothetical protein [Streptomyces subrutilus]OEJ30585.1 hypothetical protein BGK67_03765 [Streptomyces subrutilus]
MDPEITALAASAGTALVTALATEAWQSASVGVVALWRRVLPERADAVEAELDATRDDLLDARDEGDKETQAELAAEWQGRLRRLLSAHPEAADELRALLVDPQARPPAEPAVTQHATASGNSRVYQAGRDMHLGPQ